MLIPVDPSGGPAFPSRAELEAALAAPDDLSLVLRTHQLLHACADRLIYLLLPAADQEELQSLRLITKIDVAIGTGRWAAAERPVFVVLDKIRNAFAHRRDARLDQKRVDELRNCLGSWMRTVIDQQEEVEGPAEGYRLIVSLAYVCMDLTCQRIEKDHEGWREVNKALRDLRLDLREKRQSDQSRPPN